MLNAEQRLMDYQEDMETYTAIWGELQKIDMASLDVAENQTHRLSLKTGIKALGGLIADVKYEIEATQERINGIREHVRFTRAQERKGEDRAYERDVQGVR